MKARCLFCGDKGDLSFVVINGKTCWGCDECCREWASEEGRGIVEVWHDRTLKSMVTVEVPEGAMFVVDL